MIKSMTGYGKSSTRLGSTSLTVEVRTLNSKQLDINTKIPPLYREKETEIRSMISKILERGKVDFGIALENGSPEGGYRINRDLARQYHKEILALAEELQAPLGDDLVISLLRLPDVMQAGTESLNEDDWKLIQESIEDALSQADRFRTEEGHLLEKDIKMRINIILELLAQVAPYEALRITSLRERFERNQSEFIANRPGLEKFDENRFEQEIFWYLEKLDITEEKIRLEKHCKYFLETLMSTESNGRKLGFITQEIGREINTLGSKASDADIQRLVVQMKDELEKIKEQLGNIL